MLKLNDVQWGCFTQHIATLSQHIVKLFTAVSFRNKLVRLAPASLSSLVYSLWARPGAYHRVEHLIGSSIM